MLQRIVKREGADCIEVIMASCFQSFVEVSMRSVWDVGIQGRLAMFAVKLLLRFLSGHKDCSWIHELLAGFFKTSF